MTEQLKDSLKKAIGGFYQLAPEFGVEHISHAIYYAVKEGMQSKSTPDQIEQIAQQIAQDALHVLSNIVEQKKKEKI